MRTIGTWASSPGEVKRYGVDYSEWLGAKETIAAASITVEPRTLPTFDISGVVITANGVGVVFFAGHGSADADYEVVITVTTNIGQTKQDRVLFRVRDN